MAHTTDTQAERARERTRERTRGRERTREREREGKELINGSTLVLPY